MIRKPLGFDGRKLQAGEQQRVYAQNRRYFAPASIVPAPLSNPQLTGGRNTVLTAQNSGTSSPTDSATIALVAGSLTWRYKTKFNAPPNVTATPIGSASTGTLRLRGPGTKVAVIVDSTDSSDTRLVQLHAIE